MKLYNEAEIQDIADAIREVNGGTRQYKVREMNEAILNLPRVVTKTGTNSITADKSANYNAMNYSIKGIQNKRLQAEKINCLAK